jgi:hypothetical protein
LSYISLIIKSQTNIFMQIKINKQQEEVLKAALGDYIENLVGRGFKYNCAVEILNTVNSSGLINETNRIPRVLVEKEYMFSFEGGGWNTIWAKTKRGAVRKALNLYKGSDNLNPIPSSFNLASQDGIASAMSLFY